MNSVKELDDELLDKVTGGENDIPSYCEHEECGACTQCPHHHVSGYKDSGSYTEYVNCGLNQFEAYTHVYRSR